MSALVPNHRADNDRLLPLILQIHLCHRDVELAVQTRDQRFDTSALFFEGGTGWDVEVNGESSNHVLRSVITASAVQKRLKSLLRVYFFIVSRNFFASPMASSSLHESSLARNLIPFSTSSFRRGTSQLWKCGTPSINVT